MDEPTDYNWPANHFPLSGAIPPETGWPPGSEPFSDGPAGLASCFLAARVPVESPEDFPEAGGPGRPTDLGWLGPLERAILKRITADSRRTQWLCGRLAAKTAILGLVRTQIGTELTPREVEILPDRDGRPLVCGILRKTLAVPPRVSLAHAGDAAAAVAAFPAAAPLLGVDLEPHRRELSARLLAAAFSPAERRLLADLDPARPKAGYWALAAWCAKEAAAKAVGSGLVGLTGRFIVTAADPAEGIITVAVDPEMAAKVMASARETCFADNYRRTAGMAATQNCRDSAFRPGRQRHVGKPDEKCRVAVQVSIRGDYLVAWTPAATPILN